MLVLTALLLAPPIVRSEFIFEKAPFKACHASTIAETSEGALVAAWFGGDKEGAKNVAIWSSRLEGDGWSKPSKVASAHGHPCWNPVLFQPNDGPLMLFYKVGPHPKSWRGYLALSADGGRSFPGPRTLPDGILGPIKNKPIQLPDGTILYPSSDESNGESVHMERSSDRGENWTRTPDLNDPKTIEAIQPSLLPLGGRRIRAVGRTRAGRMFVIDSEDEGRSWGPMRLTDTLNPNSGIDAVRLEDGRFLLVYNDTPSGRSPLNVAISKDATHWSNVLALETGSGEYSYPAVIQSRDGLVHIVYTWKRRRIRHVVLDPKEL